MNVFFDNVCTETMCLLTLNEVFRRRQSKLFYNLDPKPQLMMNHVKQILWIETMWLRSFPNVFLQLLPLMIWQFMPLRQKELWIQSYRSLLHFKIKTQSLLLPSWLSEEYIWNILHPGWRGGEGGKGKRRGKLAAWPIQLVALGESKNLPKMP